MLGPELKAFLGGLWVHGSVTFVLLSTRATPNP